MNILSSKERARFRAEGNTLKPVVLVGKEGITKAIAGALEDYFRRHELAKIKLLQSCTQSREEIADVLCSQTQAQSVQQIGKTILLFRPLPESESAKQAR